MKKLPSAHPGEGTVASKLWWFCSASGLGLLSDQQRQVFIQQQQFQQLLNSQQLTPVSSLFENVLLLSVSGVVTVLAPPLWMCIFEVVVLFGIPVHPVCGLSYRCHRTCLVLTRLWELECKPYFPGMLFWEERESAHTHSFIPGRSDTGRGQAPHRLRDSVRGRGGPVPVFCGIESTTRASDARLTELAFCFGSLSSALSTPPPAGQSPACPRWEVTCGPPFCLLAPTATSVVLILFYSLKNSWKNIELNMAW